MSSEYGITEKRLPWLLRILFELALDGVNQERQALKEIGAPQIDAFIQYDPVLALTYRAKRVRATARYLKHGYSKERYEQDPYAAEYEFAYLRKRMPIRARLEKRDLEKMFLDIGKREGEQ